MIRNIEIGCDTPDCYAFCRMEISTIDAARERAADRWGWTRTPDGGDRCEPCTRGYTPAARGEHR